MLKQLSVNNLLTSPINELRVKKYVLVIFLILYAINVFPQSYPFRHFTAEDGLPASEVYHAYQDSKGYIWFATDNGVSRYNGYEFENYTREDGLPDNTVFEIYEDYKHRIWFIPHSAKLSYFLNDSIYEYKFNNKLLSKTNYYRNPVKLGFCVDTNESIYYSDRNNGGFIIDSSGVVNPIKDKDNEISYLIINKRIIGNRRILQNKKHPFDLKKILIYQDKQMIYGHLKEQPGINYFKAPDFGIVINNNIYFAGFFSVLCINNCSTITGKEFNSRVIWLSADNKDVLWVGTREGVYGFTNSDLNNKPKYYGLKNNSISSVLSDNEGGYWFTTLNNGVYYLPNLYTTTIAKKEGLVNENITAIGYDSTYIWLGTQNNILGFRSNKIEKRFKLDDDNLLIHKIIHDFKTNKTWIGTIGIKCIYFLQNNKLFFTTINNPKGEPLSKCQVRDIYFDEEKDIYFAGLSLAKYSNKKDKFICNPRLHNKTHAVCKKTDDVNILLGCNNGLWEYVVLNDTFEYLGGENPLLSDQINCMINNNYHKNNWIGTKSSGIVIYDNDSVYNISEKDGLSSNYITALFQKDSIIWASTINGLNKINLNDTSEYKFTISKYGLIHGLTSAEINDIYVTDSFVYAGTKKGLNIINHKEIKPNLTPPGIFLKSIKILDTDTLIKNNYTLPYSKNSIYIEYVGLMFRNNLEKRYKYQFNKVGQYAKWVNTNENSIRLSYLHPGNYEFKVKAVNEDGVESLEPAILKFKIKPPFWKTWWFITILVIITGLITYILYLSRIKEIRKRNDLEKKLLQEVSKFQQQALSQQMNPHFIFNTLNSIQYYIYNNDTESSTTYLSKFSKLMRIILDNSREDMIPIQKELDAMDLYMELESLRLDNKLEYEIIIQDDIDTHIYQIYPLLIQPYIENSIIHGLLTKKGSKKIKLELLLVNDSIKCIIEDNGIGREKAMELKLKKRKIHKSHGTNISGKRIDIINRLYHKDFKVQFIDLKDKQGNACGTRVILNIPKIIG